MSPTTQGLIVFVVTLLMLVSGIPVAFGLGAIAIVFLVLFQGFDALHVVVFKIVVDVVRGCRARATWRQPCGARSAATLSAEAAYVSLTGMDRERVKMRRLVKVKMVRRVTWADGE